MKVGIMYAQSKEYPNLMMDFIGAIKISLQDYIGTKKIEPVYESIGMGGEGKVIVEKAEKLLLIDEVNLIVAFMDFPFVEKLQPIFAKSGKLLIIVNTGANYPFSWKPLPNVICLCLHYSFCCWLTGKLAVNNQSNKAVVASSFYDCGYSHLGSITQSFLNAGGEIAFNYINKQQKSEDYTVDELTDFLASNTSIKNILCVFNSYSGKLFLNKIYSFKNHFPLNLFVSPMMFDNEFIENPATLNGINIAGYTSWLEKDFYSTPSFVDKFTEKFNRPATSISLLGYELGLMLITIFQHKIDANDSAAIIELFASKSFFTPRGELYFDVETNFFVPPVQKVGLTDELKIENINIDQLISQWHEFVENTPPTSYSGWLNTYLCY